MENEGDELIRFSETATTGDAVFTADALEIYPEECGQTAVADAFRHHTDKNVSVHVFPEMTLVPGASPSASRCTQRASSWWAYRISCRGTVRRGSRQEARLQPGDIILEAEESL